MELEKESKTAHEIIKVEQCNYAYEEADILLLTKSSNDTELCVWVCTQELELHLLIESNQTRALAEDSFFCFMNVARENSTDSSNPNQLS